MNKKTIETNWVVAIGFAFAVLFSILALLSE